MHQTHALLNGDCNSCALARASVAETGSCMERSTASTWLPEQSASRARRAAARLLPAAPAAAPSPSSPSVLSSSFTFTLLGYMEACSAAGLVF